MSYRIKNWEKFQHFKFRNPPWIKLYRNLLEDMQWHSLSGESAKLLVMLWLIASESNGKLPDSRTLAFKLRTRETSVNDTLSTLSHWIEQDDITTISEGYHDDMKKPNITALEKEKEKEKEKDFSLVLLPSNNTQAEVLLTFPTNGKSKEWLLRADALKNMGIAFPGVDILSECKKALLWCQSNPTRRKTGRGMPRFLFGWLERCQNSNKSIKTTKREVVG